MLGITAAVAVVAEAVVAAATSVELTGVKIANTGGRQG